MTIDHTISIEQWPCVMENWPSGDMDIVNLQRALFIVFTLLASSCRLRETEEIDVSIEATGGDRVAESGTMVEGSVQLASSPFPDIQSAVDLALGDDDARCASFSDGSVWCWNDRDRDRIPHRIEHLGQTARLFGGADRFCAENHSGRVMCWRPGEEPELLPVPALTSMAMTDGGGCALLPDGSVRCWGLSWNRSAQPLPGVEPVMGIAAAEALDGYSSSRCVVTRSHEIVCWGWDRFQHLGERSDAGTFQHGSIRDAVDVALTRENVWWVSDNGHLRVMVRGVESVHEHGTYRYDPVEIRGVEGVTAIESARDIYAITSSGRLWRIDFGSREPHREPIEGVMRLVTADRAGDICARTASGWMCRDENGNWAPLSWASRVNRTRASAGTSGPSCGDGFEHVGIDSLAGGYGHFCSRVSDGRVRCWGMNHDGQVGGELSSDDVRSRAPTLPRPAVSIAAAMHFSCAILNDGSMWCWGQDAHGQLGRGRDRNTGTPVQVGIRGRVVDMALGSSHACATTDRHQLWCWGDNSRGQLGNGTRTAHYTPERVRTLNEVGSIAAGHDSTCAVSNRRTMCWGGLTGSDVPTEIEGLNRPVQQLSVGATTACALVEGGTIWCWGSGALGQLGPAESIESRTPVRIEGLPSAHLVTAYDTRFCAVGADGSAWCWGRPSRVPRVSSSRRGETPSPAIPSPISWVRNARTIAIGDRGACVVEQTGGVCCSESLHGADGAPHPLAW